MEKYIITTGKSIDLAIQSALAELQLNRDAVSVEVLENARSGFLGIGACPAKVKVTYEVPDPKPAEPAPALSSASRKPKKQAPKLEKPLEMPAPLRKPEAPKVEKPAEAPKQEAPKAEKPAKKQAPRREAPKTPAVRRSYCPQRRAWNPQSSSSLYGFSAAPAVPSCRNRL